MGSSVFFLPQNSFQVQAVEAPTHLGDWGSERGSYLLCPPYVMRGTNHKVPHFHQKPFPLPVLEGWADFCPCAGSPTVGGVDGHGCTPCCCVLPLIMILSKGTITLKSPLDPDGLAKALMKLICVNFKLAIVCAIVHTIVLVLP